MLCLFVFSLCVSALLTSTPAYVDEYDSLIEAPVKLSLNVTADENDADFGAKELPTELLQLPGYNGGNSNADEEDDDLTVHRRVKRSPWGSRGSRSRGSRSRSHATRSRSRGTGSSRSRSTRTSSSRSRTSRPSSRRSSSRRSSSRRSSFRGSRSRSSSWGRARRNFPSRRGSTTSVSSSRRGGWGWGRRTSVSSSRKLFTKPSVNARVNIVKAVWNGIKSIFSKGKKPSPKKSSPKAGTKDTNDLNSNAKEINREVKKDKTVIEKQSSSSYSDAEKAFDRSVKPESVRTPKDGVKVGTTKDGQTLTLRKGNDAAAGSGNSGPTLDIKEPKGDVIHKIRLKGK